jgi:hypothetical protein
MIEAAARQGRVETLLVATRPWCREHFPAGVRVVQLGADETFSHCELLDRAAAETLSRGGQVHALRTPEIPGGSDIAAVFRYLQLADFGALARRHQATSSPYSRHLARTPPARLPCSLEDQTVEGRVRYGPGAKEPR